jgi:hypothetical protein
MILKVEIQNLNYENWRFNYFYQSVETLIKISRKKRINLYYSILEVYLKILLKNKIKSSTVFFKGPTFLLS